MSVPEWVVLCGAAGGAARPAELDGRIVGHEQLVPAEAVRLAGRETDRTIRMELTGGMMHFDWGINDRRFDHHTPTEDMQPVRAGERVRLEFVNRTTMWHPMHLHGHTFAVGDGGARRDTVNVLPGQGVSAVFEADNPGLWAVHCHNIYRAEVGMMAFLGYLR